MEGNIIFYTTGCSRCAILKKKLDAANVPYEICSDVDEMQALGLSEAPALAADGKLMGFGDAVRWANSYGQKE